MSRWYSAKTLHKRFPESGKKQKTVYDVESYLHEVIVRVFT